MEDIVDELVTRETLNNTLRKTSPEDIETTEQKHGEYAAHNRLLACDDIYTPQNDKWRIASLNVHGSPETPKYVQKLMLNHNMNILGVMETHLHPASKIRTRVLRH